MSRLRLAVLLFLGASCSAAAQVFDIPFLTEPPTRTLLIAAPKAKATVLLYIGGDGVLRLSSSGQTAHRNPLVRSKDYWARHGINAVLVDSPHDLGGAGRGHHRVADDHVDRVESVARFYRTKMKHPVWIMGHSMGTSTVSAVATRRPGIQDVVAGLIVAGTHEGESIPAAVRLPVMAIHHARDGCRFTPISASEAIVRSRPPGARAELVLIEGGLDQGPACQGLGYHGFHQVEGKLVDAATRFILAH